GESTLTAPIGGHHPHLAVLGLVARPVHDAGAVQRVLGNVAVRITRAAAVDEKPSAAPVGAHGPDLYAPGVGRGQGNAAAVGGPTRVNRSLEGLALTARRWPRRRCQSMRVGAVGVCDADLRHPRLWVRRGE